MQRRLPLRHVATAGESEQGYRKLNARLHRRATCSRMALNPKVTRGDSSGSDRQDRLRVVRRLECRGSIEAGRRTASQRTVRPGHRPT